MLTETLIFSTIAFCGYFFAILTIVKCTGITIVALCIILAANDLLACKKVRIEIVFALSRFTQVWITQVFCAAILIVA